MPTQRESAAPPMQVRTVLEQVFHRAGRARKTCLRLDNYTIVKLQNASGASTLKTGTW